jgi:hypothetical protein
MRVRSAAGRACAPCSTSAAKAFHAAQQAGETLHRCLQELPEHLHDLLHALLLRLAAALLLTLRTAGTFAAAALLLTL